MTHTWLRPLANAGLVLVLFLGAACDGKVEEPDEQEVPEPPPCKIDPGQPRPEGGFECAS